MDSLRSPAARPAILPQPGKLGHRWLLTTFLVLLLSGCVTAKKENFKPPEGLEARQCLEFCRSSRFECRQAVQQDYDACEIRFEYRNESYRRCVAQRGVSRCIGLKPVPCGTPPYRQCTELYDECFVGCGGVIE